jgi:hypothetical protein
MKRLAFLTLLLCACFVAASAGQSKEHQSVSIVVMHETSGPPMTVTFRAMTKGFAPPLRFHWSFGNGSQWAGPEPPRQLYEGGSYNVILTVTDAEGRIKEASMTVYAEGEHSH